MASVKYRCPTRRQPTDSEEHQDFPFCSERCRLLDLGEWAAEEHKISEPAFNFHDDSSS